MTQETRASRDRGAVIPFMAIALGVLVLMTAFSVDLGRQMLKRRDIQAVADVVAIDLARHLNGQPVSWYTNPANTVWQAQITESRERNGFPGPDTVHHKLEFEYGETNPVTRVFTALPAAGIPTAVKVRITDTIDYYFAPGEGGAVRTAVAGFSGLVDWRLGSYLAAVSPLQQGVLNGIIGNLFGTPLSLTALSYQGLANANITIGQLATQMGFATPNDLLAGSVNTKQAVIASMNILSAQGGNVAAIAALNTIQQNMNSTSTVNIGDLVEVEQGAPAAAFNSSFNVLQFLTGAASLINGNTFVTINNLNAGVPGVTSVNVSMKVIQKEIECLGCPVGEPRSESQIELTITPTLNVDLNALLLGARLTGTVTVNSKVAGATGRATAIRCGSSKGVDLGVTPSPVNVVASESLTLSARVLFVVIPVLGVTVNNAAATFTGTPGSASFAYPTGFLPTVGTGTPARIGSATLGLSGLLSASSANATILGGTIPLGTLLNTTNAGLNPVLANLDSIVIAEITKALGVNLGGGDIGPMEMYCVGPNLVG